MNQLIEDLLTYSKIGSTENEVVELNLAHILDNVIRNLSVIISEKSANIIIEHIPQKIFANKTKFTQLLQNLIANSLKFQKPGQIPEIRINAREESDHWFFKIVDNGIGIAEEYHDKIFDLFKRLHGKSGYEGSGIGLAYCKRVVEKHNGEIWLESELGEGTKFFFTISK